MTAPAVEPSPPAAPASPLEPDREQIAQFVNALFRYAAPGTFVAMRAFEAVVRSGTAIDVPFYAHSVRMVEGEKGLSFLTKDAGETAYRAANSPPPGVFCPPIATFVRKNSATAENLAQGLDLSVELDERPLEAVVKL